jgi:hypothetical protein
VTSPCACGQMIREENARAKIARDNGLDPAVFNSAVPAVGPSTGDACTIAVKYFAAPTPLANGSRCVSDVPAATPRTWC